ncbi:MAG: hypothetical protein ACLP41_15810 [Acidimicrobiales bacterium]
MSIQKRKLAVGLVTAVAAFSLMLPLLGAGASGASTHAVKAPSITSLPRAETLYTSGAAYSAPTNWNPMNEGNFATGTQGLLYETLFLYNPVTNTYIPWLAKSGTWTTPSTYISCCATASHGATGAR